MDDKRFNTMEQRLARLEKAVFGRKGKTKPSSTGANASNFSGPTGGVRLLISKRFLKKKQGLSDVRAALAEKEYHYSRQAVHAALNSLAVKGGPLVSLQEGGRTVYVERK